MTVIQSLKSLTAYPVPAAALQSIAAGCGLQADAELAPEMAGAAELKHARAQVYAYLATAPNVSQNGVSFSFGSDERRLFKKMARALLREIGEDAGGLGAEYGYVGESF